MSRYEVKVRAGKRNFSTYIDAESEEAASKAITKYWDNNEYDYEITSIEAATERQFDYHCNWCGYEFFVEEGYNMDADDIVCPHCRCIRCHSNYFIKEL